MTREHKEKIGKVNKGRLFTKGQKKSPFAHSFKKGHIHSKETKRKMSIASKGKPKSEEAKRNLSKAIKGKRIGVENPNWKGGIAPINQKIRGSLEYKLWQDSVKNRDCNCCQKCGENRISKLTAHHILNFSSHPELRFAIDNGITFCRDCHKLFHKKYGIKNNTREQLQEFLKVRK